tara:strand:- start:2573 stop:3076 length:504 start_codon:yes stop_codon:yes gene_type:complete
MERNNEASPGGQRQLHPNPDYINDATRQNFDERIDSLNNPQSSGRINNTKDGKPVSDEINQLEDGRQKTQDRLDRDSEEDGRRGEMPNRSQDDPTMDEREAAAGLRGTTTGRDSSEQQERQTTGEDGELPDEKDNDDPLGTFGVIICINGRPHSASIYGQIGPKLGN